MGHILSVLLLVAAITSPALAGDEGTATVGEVVDGDTVVLDRKPEGDGSSAQVRLVGIQAPKLPLGRPDFPTWPLADDSKKALESLVLGKVVALTQKGRVMDRHGRLLAHLHTADGVWIQGEMLRRGMARVYSFPDNRAKVDDMLALERQARAEKKGIWGHPFYAIREPDESAAPIGTFQLVEGRVADAAPVRGALYLNFGKDWRSDFTILIPGKALRLFQDGETDPRELKGRLVRVRGWLKKRNGPMIEVSHPEQLEILAEQLEIPDE